MNNTIPISGLSTEEATKRFLKQSAPKHSHTKTTLSIIWSNVFSPFTFINIVVIITLVSLYFYWSDTKLLLDCVGIVLVVTANTVIAIIQEIRARTIIEKARLLQQHLCTVIRDGNHQQIEHTDIVLGDIVFVKRGDAIPIDGEIRISNGLEVDESLITGESDVIIKPVNSMVTSGSICVAGEGYIECTTIQTESYAQKISSLAQTYSVTRSPLQRKINQIFEWSFFVALVLIGIEIFANFISNKPFTIDFVRRSATVVLTLIPEGIVFFSTVTFAIAVVKAQKLGVIIQKLSSIESLAGIDVLCFDKTGTLTDATIHFSEAISLQKTTPLSPEIIHLYAQHSTEKSALISALTRNEIDNTYTKVNEIPFSSERKFSAIELVESDGNRLTLYLGAIEALESYITIEDIPLLEGITSVPKRTLLLCSSTESLHLNQPKNLIPQIVIYFEEQIKYDVVPTLELCKKMGIQTIIISGDSPTYIASILHRLNHSFEGTIVEGTSLLSSQPIPLSTVYARMTPHQKADVIHQYQQNGRVAMVGDGVNDVPALKAADLSIAMNAGSTITREISDIVLQNNSFESIPALFSMGRTIIASCLVITQMYLVKNIIVVLFTIVSMISSIPFPFTPRRSGLLGLLTTAVPAYFFSLYNSAETTTKEFFQRVWSILIPSSLVSTIGAMVVSMYSQQHLGATVDQTATINLSVLVVTLLLNIQFLASIQNHFSSKSFILTLSLLGVYTTILLVPRGVWGLTLIQDFYEISTLPWQYTIAVLFVGIVIALFVNASIWLTYRLLKIPIGLHKTMYH